MSTSSIKFDAAYGNASLTKAVDVLREWLQRHPSLEYFTFDQLCAELGHRVPVDHLNRVLLRLVAAGELAVTYRVKLHEGEYSEEEFKTPEEVPSLVFDSAFEPVSVSEERKVPSFSSPK